MPARTLSPEPRTARPVVVRITHWVNAFAMTCMILSGWRIYNASPLFPFNFPPGLTLGGWLAGALAWHFAAMWLLVANALVYLAYSVASGYFRRTLLPLTPRRLIADKRPWSLAQLRALPQATQVTRHVCVEGWSAIGQWRGVPFRTFLERVGADTHARYVGFRCFDDYYSSIDMATALHPQTVLALDYGDAPLPPKYGSPLKLRVPTKLGFKNPKHIAAVFVSNTNPGGYWEDQGYNWFSGL